MRSAVLQKPHILFHFQSHRYRTGAAGQSAAAGQMTSAFTPARLPRLLTPRAPESPGPGFYFDTSVS